MHNLIISTTDLAKECLTRRPWRPPRRIREETHGGSDVDVRLEWGYTMFPTRDHDQIRKWANCHSANPAEIRRLKYDGEPAILTFIVGNPSIARPDIYPISWASFFAQFDLLNLSMAFDKETPRFNIVKVEKRPDQLAN